MHLKAFAAVLGTAVLATGLFSVGHAKALSITSNESNTVVVAPGDTLSGVAGRNGTTYHRLFDANLQIQSPDLIFPGETIQIPAASEQLADRTLPASSSAPSPAPAPAPAAQPTLTNTVEQPAPAPVSAPAPVPAPVAAPAPAAPAFDATDLSVWDELAQCESSGNWSIDTGNGFYGGLQFTLSSWQAVGGTGYPNQASKAEQIARAQILQSEQGWGAWPACSAKLGL